MSDPDLSHPYLSHPYQYPRLRWPLEIRLEKHAGEEALLIYCPLGVSPRPLALVPAVAPLLACFEGKLSVPEIADKFKDYGVSQALVQELIRLLDDNLYLVTPRFDAAQADIIAQFKSSPVRAAALAGLGYPADAEQLRALVDGYLDAGGAARPPRGLVGLMAPHIDYRRGGVCYGRTYHFLKEQQHGLFLIFGTAHQYSRSLFQLTAKDFATPLGTIPCDARFVQEVASRYGPDRSFADEIAHRREHSIELQTPFLKRLNDSAAAVPVLVGSFHKMMVSGRPPDEHDEYAAFIESIAQAARARLREGAGICIIAGVDMAHVGRHFGDQDALSAEFMSRVESRDRQYLQTIVRQDKRALFQHVAEDQDRYRICGFPSMYTVVDLFDRLEIRYRAEIFDYRQAVDYESDCAVTFAGVGFYQ